MSEAAAAVRLEEEIPLISSIILALIGMLLWALARAALPVAMMVVVAIVAGALWALSVDVR